MSPNPCEAPREAGKRSKKPRHPLWQWPFVFLASAGLYVPMLVLGYVALMLVSGFHP